MDQGYLDVQAVRRILAAGSGDAALLYLCRTCGLSDVVTGFSEARNAAIECLEDKPPCSYIIQEYIDGIPLSQMLKDGYRFQTCEV